MVEDEDVDETIKGFLDDEAGFGDDVPLVSAPLPPCAPPPLPAPNDAITSPGHQPYIRDTETGVARMGDPGMGTPGMGELVMGSPRAGDRRMEDSGVGREPGAGWDDRRVLQGLQGPGQGSWRPYTPAADGGAGFDQASTGPGGIVGRGGFDGGNGREEREEGEGSAGMEDFDSGSHQPEIEGQSWAPAPTPPAQPPPPPPTDGMSEEKGTGDLPDPDPRLEKTLKELAHVPKETISPSELPVTVGSVNTETVVPTPVAAGQPPTWLLGGHQAPTGMGDDTEMLSSDDEPLAAMKVRRSRPLTSAKTSSAKAASTMGKELKEGKQGKKGKEAKGGDIEEADKGTDDELLSGGSRGSEAELGSSSELSSEGASSAASSSCIDSDEELLVSRARAVKGRKPRAPASTGASMGASAGGTRTSQRSTNRALKQSASASAAAGGKAAEPRVKGRERVKEGGKEGGGRVVRGRGGGVGGRKGKKATMGDEGENENDEEEDEEGSGNLVLSTKSRERSRKEALVAQVLARWWYCMDAWPPPNFDYEAELQRRKLRCVAFEDWEEADDIDSHGFQKVYQIAHFPGIYRNPQGKALDLRPMEGRPCFSNLKGKPEAELTQMLRTALKNQIEALKNSPYRTTDQPLIDKLEKDLQHAIAST